MLDEGFLRGSLTEWSDVDCVEVSVSNAPMGSACERGRVVVVVPLARDEEALVDEGNDVEGEEERVDEARTSEATVGPRGIAAPTGHHLHISGASGCAPTSHHLCCLPFRPRRKGTASPLPSAA